MTISTTELQIVNQALAQAQARSQLTSMQDQSAEGRYARLFYDDTRRGLIRAAPLLMLLLCACGSPLVVGQSMQECVNAALNVSAPPPQYVQASRDQVRAPYDARYGNGVVVLTSGAKGSRLAAHEATRHATWYAFDRQPTEAEFALTDRHCGGRWQ